MTICFRNRGNKSKTTVLTPSQRPGIGCELDAAHCAAAERRVTTARSMKLIFRTNPSGTGRIYAPHASMAGLEPAIEAGLMMLIEAANPYIRPLLQWGR